METFFRVADISLDSRMSPSNRSVSQLSFVARRLKRSKALHVMSTNVIHPVATGHIKSLSILVDVNI
jgi:hypothetical protein